MIHFFSKKAISRNLGILVVIGLFIVSSFVGQRYEMVFAEMHENNSGFAMASYFIITILAVVITPLASAPIIPLATHTWGGLATALLSICGWTIGAMIAFGITRKYGRPHVEKSTVLKRVAQFEKRIPDKFLFIGIVTLRMLVPVDILSYVLGLSSRITAKIYFFATFIGVTPFAFIMSYLGYLPWQYQGASAMIALIVFAGIFYFLSRHQDATPHEAV